MKTQQQTRESQPRKRLQPLVKWAGGKSILAEYIIKKFDSQYNTYYEPFLGGASILFTLQPQKAICSDINKELINFYEVVKKSPDELINRLNSDFKGLHSKEFYYKVRAWDRQDCYEERSDVERAARFIYLNKNCYNGLWRENQHGQNNVPIGDYPKINLPQKEQILAVSDYLSKHNITLTCNDYKKCLKDVCKNDLVYLDPPYDVDDSQKGFVDYSSNGFTKKDQEELKSLCDELIEKGAKIYISNSDTEFIRKLYSNPSYYTIYDDKEVTRFVGSRKEYRKKVVELFIVGKRPE